jgi:hypothetical protein
MQKAVYQHCADSASSVTSAPAQRRRPADCLYTIVTLYRSGVFIFVTLKDDLVVFSSSYGNLFLSKKHTDLL